MARQALEHYDGDTVIYVGEGPSGCTADDDFFEVLSGCWASAERIAIPQWDTIHDDLVADHIPCPRCEWPKGAFQRNKAIFERKWQWPVTYSAAVGS